MVQHLQAPSLASQASATSFSCFPKGLAPSCFKTFTCVCVCVCVGGCDSHTHKTTPHLLTLSNSSEVAREGCLSPGRGQISSCMSLGTLHSPRHSSFIYQSVCKLCLPGCDLIHACLPCSLDTIITDCHMLTCVSSSPTQGAWHIINRCSIIVCSKNVSSPCLQCPSPSSLPANSYSSFKTQLQGLPLGAGPSPSSVLSLRFAHPFTPPLTTLD